MATQVPANPQAERQRIYRSIVLRAQRLRIHGAIVSVYGRLTTALRQRRPDLENSIWFDMADMLSPEFETQVKALADEIIHNSCTQTIGCGNTITNRDHCQRRSRQFDTGNRCPIRPVTWQSRMGPQFYTGADTTAKMSASTIFSALSHSCESAFRP